eukprot:gene2025-3936_t
MVARRIPDPKNLSLQAKCIEYYQKLNRRHRRCGAIKICCSKPSALSTTRKVSKVWCNKIESVAPSIKYYQKGIKELRLMASKVWRNGSASDSRPEGRGFDNIDTDSDEESTTKQTISGVLPVKTTNSTTLPNLPKATMTQKGKDGRLRFEYGGRTIFEWEQSLEEVNIYIDLPPGATRDLLNIIITHRHLTVGLKGAPPYIDENTGGPVKPKESYWMLSDNEININLQKMNKAERWESALVGSASDQKMDPFTAEEIKKKMMIERFAEEHPAFDFSNADFNGMVPDARDFMGGVKYT